MLKVLHVIPSYFPATYWGGPAFSVYELNNALARRGDLAIKVLTTDAAGPAVSQRLDASTLEDVYSEHEVLMTRRIAASSVSFELLTRLSALISWADVVHVSATYSFPTIPTLLFARIRRRPVVWSLHGAMLEASTWAGARKRPAKLLWERVCREILSDCTAVIHATSEREGEIAARRLPGLSVKIVPNGVTVPTMTKARRWLPNGTLRVMYIGRLSPIKGLERLLDAFALLRHIDATLTVYGTGAPAYIAKLRAHAEELQLGGRVVFAGVVLGQEKTNAFEHADLCVFPSHSENFCIAIAESLAHSVPVVASTGTPWRAVETIGCGRWVPNAPDAIRDAILELRAADLAELGRKGREWMRREYSWEIVANAMSAVYVDILAHARSRHVTRRTNVMLSS